MNHDEAVRHVREAADAWEKSGEVGLREANALLQLLEERERLQAFKAYVHERLDSAGVPLDPNSPHRDAGCRIGGRLDVLINERDLLREEREREDRLLRYHFIPSIRLSNSKGLMYRWTRGKKFGACFFEHSNRAEAARLAEEAMRK
jgi:hypothetical protein